MNVASLIPINVVAPGLPPVSNLAGVIKEGEGGPRQRSWSSSLKNSPTTAGLDFPNGVTLVGCCARNVKLGNRAGSHMLAATYCHRRLHLVGHERLGDPAGRGREAGKSAGIVVRRLLR